MFQSNPNYKKIQRVLNPYIGYGRNTVHNISSWWAVGGLILILGLGFFTQYRLNSLPTPLLTEDAISNPDAFISERAFHDLKILNDFGPKPTGSYANEVLAVDFLKREINEIQQSAHINQRIINDVQIVSGAYYGGFRPHGMTNVYRSVQNVLVKLVGQSERDMTGNNSLMLNCHFDSVAGSPGASDDGASCCVMLEILRVLSRHSVVNRHSIIFLFNGAEETPLQASHGFITQHEWAKQIRAFLNLESVGSGGKEVLFQTGPKHSWLTRIYGKVVPHPSGQTAAEEIFQSGVIPSDTDFRIFRDFGHVPGMDFAHYINGYRYHTKYDSIKYLSLDVLQRTGDNILALTREIANCVELADTEMHAKGTSVFFDFLGLFFVTYSKNLGTFFNVIVSVLSTTIPFLSLKRSTCGIHSKYLKTEIRIGLLSTVVSVIISASVCYILAILYDAIDRSMSWYSTPCLVIGLYCAPALLVQCFTHIIVDRLLCNLNTPISLALRIQVQQNGTNLFWASIVLGLTFNGYRIGYIGMVILLFTTISNSIIAVLDIQNSLNKWLYVQMISHVMIILWTTHFYHLIIGMFIPITGRSGALKNPDITIGLICAAMTFFVTSCLSPLILLLRAKRVLFYVLFVVFVTSIFTIGSTPLGFPYRDASGGSPKPQRHFITHASRTFYDRYGHVRYTDAGFWLREMDRNARKTIESLSTPDVPIPQLENNMCNTEVFCGIPLYSARQLHIGGYWLPGPAPVVKDVATLTLKSRVPLDDDLIRLNFTITGDVLLSFLVRPREGVKLEDWNILDDIPEPNEFNGKKSYFVMITHGVKSEPMNVVLDLRTPYAGYAGDLVDITVVTTHWEYHREHTATFAKLLVRVPKWAFAVPSVAALNAYTY